MSTDHVGLLPTSRLDAFSDGVFAIAITLLVLELDVPTAGDALLGDLGQAWPSYLGYLVSFTFIGAIWVAHSTMSKFLRAADQLLVGLNLILLLLVSILPFTTKLMATHLDDSGEHAAVVIFGINLLLASILMNLILSHAASRPDLIDTGSADQLTAFARQRRIVLVVQAVATLMGLLVPTVAVMIYLVVSLIMLIEPIWRAARNHRMAKMAAAKPSNSV
jgi:uncharacterized membrane protein